jgi:hypothetical protein
MHFRKIAARIINSTFLISQPFLNIFISIIYQSVLSFMFSALNSTIRMLSQKHSIIFILPYLCYLVGRNTSPCPVERLTKIVYSE